MTRGAVLRLTALLGALLAVVLLVNPAAASAHAVLLSSTPASDQVLTTAPGAIELIFNEPVRAVPDRIRILDSTGHEQDASVAVVDAVVRIAVRNELARGSYLVDWRVVSADGHPIAGAFVFSVGAPTEISVRPQSADGWTTVAKQIADIAAYLGILALIGLAVFRVFGLVGGLDQAWRHVTVGMWGSAAITCAALIAHIPIAAALDGFIPTDVVVASALGGFGSVIVLAGRKAGIAGVVSLASALPTVGHTRTFGPVQVVMATDFLHVLAAGTWFGGLIGLLLTVRQVGSVGWVPVVRVIDRFSTMAASLAAIVVVTGVVLAWRILGSWGALLASDYGTLLLIKLGIAAIVFAIAAYNRWIVVPKSETSAVLRWTVRAEIAMLIVVVCVTGFLSSANPHEVTAKASVVNESIGELTLHAELTGKRIGPNAVEVHIFDQAGRPAELLSPPELELRPEGTDIGPLRVPAKPVAPGQFSADVTLPLIGVWELTVTARISKFESETRTFEVTID